MLLMWMLVLATLGPLVYLAARELRVGRGDERVAEGESGLWLWVGWYLVLLLGCRWVLEWGGGTLRDKGAGEWADDVRTGCLCAVVLHQSTGVGVKWGAGRGVFAGLTLLGVAAYTCIFEASRSLHITVTSEPADTLQGLVLAAFVVVACFITLYHSHAVTPLVIPAAAVLCLHAFCYIIPGQSQSRVHVHHQWWALVMSFVPSRVVSPASLWSQALLLGVHVHGLAAFGNQPVFINVK